MRNKARILLNATIVIYLNSFANLLCQKSLEMLTHLETLGEKWVYNLTNRRWSVLKKQKYSNFVTSISKKTSRSIILTGERNKFRRSISVICSGAGRDLMISWTCTGINQRCFKEKYSQSISIRHWDGIVFIFCSSTPDIRPCHR